VRSIAGDGTSADDTPGLQRAHAAGALEPLRAVVCDFTVSGAGEHACAFLGDWRGSLVRDVYTGYKASFALGVTEAGCMAHARRKFVELHESNMTTIAAAAIDLIGQLYGIEREVKLLSAQQRLHERRTRVDAKTAKVDLQARPIPREVSGAFRDVGAAKRFGPERCARCQFSQNWSGDKYLRSIWLI
jgi:hypothetical protein